MANSNYSVVAGVLSIVSGVFGIFSSIGMILVSLVFWSAISVAADTPDEFPLYFFQTIYLVLGIVFLILAILAIIGGVFALQRKHWRMALTGAIAAVLTFFPTGIAAVIFVGLSKQDFK